MTEQLNLTPVHGGDGSESREAARRVDGHRQYGLVLLCLLQATNPLTDDEIAARCGLLRHAAGTRRGVGVKLGHVYRAGRGMSELGNPAATWALTDAGREEAWRLRGGSAEGQRGVA